MATTESPAAIQTIHMHATYFADDDSVVSPDDVARVFRQLDLLVKYAGLVSHPTRPFFDEQGRRAQQDAQLDQVGLEAGLLAARLRLQLEPADEAGQSEIARIREDLRAAKERGHLAERANRPTSVVSIAMGSPLTAVLELPAVAWTSAGLGLLYLIERIATAPARIATKQRDELSCSRKP